MKKKHVFIADELAVAERGVAQARRLGIGVDDITVVARDDARLEPLPEGTAEDSPTDFKPAALRGAIGGGSTGLLMGLVAASVPTMGVTLAGAGLFALVGAAIGTWSSALVGAAVPNKVAREFEDHVRNGKVLVVLDVEEDALAQADAAMRQAGLRKAAFEEPTALS